ncbi:hypothetical protein HFO04_27955 [Rhizobium laguerreae]|uniref:hypothetical protein n=1 Tax=Rhizobium laguerreae TaxID=1076926 RepID=UPI001C90373A|nr:hypothetical protein [Rhizobium laguerreae]MBY3306574.1 hypothetical protein [Rhizobium laguerreae]
MAIQVLGIACGFVEPQERLDRGIVAAFGYRDDVFRTKRQGIDVSRPDFPWVPDVEGLFQDRLSIGVQNWVRLNLDEVQ